MDDQLVPQMLAAWAGIFRTEGDAQTADAIDAQLRVDAQRSLSEDETARLDRCLAHAANCGVQGAYGHAADSYAKALEIVEQALGGSHPRVYECLLDVARCRLNDGQYQAALRDYLRLQHLVEARYGSSDSLAATARHYVQRCHDAIRHDAVTLRLHSYVHGMVMQAQNLRTMDAAERADRLRNVACRLAARGRRALALRLHDQAIALRLEYAAPDDDLAYLDLHQHALDLRDAGNPARASDVLRWLVGKRSLASAVCGQQQHLRAVLSDLATCLAAQGLSRSARETAALAERLGEGPPE